MTLDFSDIKVLLIDILYEYLYIVNAKKCGKSLFYVGLRHEKPIANYTCWVTYFILICVGKHIVNLAVEEIICSITTLIVRQDQNGIISITELNKQLSKRKRRNLNAAHNRFEHGIPSAKSCACNLYIFIVLL